MRMPPSLLLALLAAPSLALAQPPSGQLQTYLNPVQEGYRLAYCDVGGKLCGEPVASAWCRAQGFEKASDWKVAEQIGASEPTMTVVGGRLCSSAACDGFSLITCARETRTFRGPNIASLMNSTVLTPDQRTVEAPITSVEYQLLVPGCHQREPGVLLCETLHDYQHCRTLFAAGVIMGCRAGLAFDGDIADAHVAALDSYHLDLRSSAAATVYQGRREQGKAKGEARYAVRFEPPAGGTCLQRDRYVYYPTGPQGGVSTIDATAACKEPVSGRFAPHEDDLLRVYDLCTAKAAWGSRIESSIELLVAGLYYMMPPTTDPSSAPLTAHIDAPYLTISAPLRVDCHR
jgi:hypothetical protein